MPVFVRNETKSVKDDYNFGFPSEDTLNKMKEKILVLKIKGKQYLVFSVGLVVL